MPGNSFGHAFRLTTFGESHGAAIGGVIDGCPAGLPLALAAVQDELDRRRPGSTPLGTARNEADRVEWLGGILEGRALGTPIAFLIRNADARPADYEALRDVFRPGHADRAWQEKFGVRDHRGGGRSSARVTAACVAAGAIARQLLAREGIRVQAWVSAVGEEQWPGMPGEEQLAARWSDAVRCPDPAASERMAAAIAAARAAGDSLGGIVSCIVHGTPAGLGEPVFDRLDADLAKAMLGINATKGFQLDEGFNAARMRGSAHNQCSQGGVSGGISDG
ncbi:MAG: chorismate synthase, partial [Flavobacteriales bacterium]